MGCSGPEWAVVDCWAVVLFSGIERTEVDLEVLWQTCINHMKDPAFRI